MFWLKRRNKEDKKIVERCHMPFISLERYDINDSTSGVISYEFIRAHKIIPLDVIGGTIVIAATDVPSENLLKRIEKLTGFRARPIMITDRDFKRHMDIYNLSIVHKEGEEPDRSILKYVDAPSYKGRERRRHTRSNRRVKVRYEYREEININFSVNISRGGILIKSKSPASENTCVILRIQLPLRREDVVTMAKVIWTERTYRDDSCYFIALSFSSMGLADHEALVNFVESSFC